MTQAHSGALAWDAAHALLGSPFRLQGRDPQTGLDCIGLILAAYEAAGVRLHAIDHYRLRGASRAVVERGLDDSGLRRAEGAAVLPGDVGLFLLPAAQLHVALLAPGQMIHADAGLRRVAWAPADRLPPPAARWRWSD
jgi:cell wall-associated NlpC family hydrolase